VSQRGDAPPLISQHEAGENLVTVDFRTAEGQAVQSLNRGTDIVIEISRFGGLLIRSGLASIALSSRLIYVQITGFGKTAYATVQGMNYISRNVG